MKVAILSESPADEAAVRILVGSILGRETRHADLPPIRTRGWPSVRRVTPSVLRDLHYQTDADALVIVADADTSPLHNATHGEYAEAESRCRLCQLRKKVAQAQKDLSPVTGRQRVQTAIGIAVPAIEAWYLCDVDPQVNEARWIQLPDNQKNVHYKNQLKHDVYRTERPSMEIKTQRAVEAAQRVGQLLHLLEQWFPNGFAPLANDVHRWNPA